METSSILYLVLYAIAWGITLWVVVKKNKNNWKADSFIIATYFLFAVLSVIYYVFFLDDYYNPLTLFPLIYLYIMLMIGLGPVFVYSRNEYKSIEKPSNLLINSLFVFYILLTIINIPDTISHMQEGLVMLMMDDNAGSDLYFSTKDSYVGNNDSSISNIFSVFYNFLSPICVFLFFYYLTLPRRKKIFIILLALSIIVQILYSLSNGQRTGPVMISLVFLATFFLMKPYLEEKIRKRMIWVTMVLSFVLLIPFIALTNSRFGNYSTGAGGSVISYAGQAPVVFDSYCLDAGGIRYGDRTAPEFKRLLGFKNVPKDEPSRRAKYSNLKVDAGSFYTYVGDFVLDYGPVGAFFIFSFFSPFFILLTKHRKRSVIPFHKLLLVYFAMTVCVQGGMYLFNYAHYGNYSIMAIFLIYLVFYFDYKQKKKFEVIT